MLVSDIRMQGGSGLDLLAQLKERMPGLPVIIMTAYSDLDSAVSAFQGGAFEYLPKPFDLTKAIELIRRALEESQREAVGAVDVDSTPEMLGQAPAMQDVFRAIGRLQIVLDLFETVSTRPDFYFQARDQLKVAEENLTTRLAGHWERMRIARKNEDPFLALTELNGIIDLIPDPQQLEYQRATIYKRRIKEIILAEKK